MNHSLEHNKKIKKEKINVKKLIKNLMSKDKYVRKAAVLSIIKYRGKKVLYLPGVVKNREEIFNIISDKRMVEPLIHTLKDEDTIVRKESAITLGVIGDKRAVEPLIHALRDKDIKVRCAAALALGEIGDKRATKPLIQAIKDENRDIRESVIKAIGEIGDKRAIEQITNALYDYDIWVRKAATLALMKLDITMVLKIFETGQKIVKEAINGDIDLDYPLFFYELGGVRPIIGELLIYKAVELTIQKLKDKDIDVRKESAIALKHIGDERAVGPLIHALRDKDIKVRCAAALALGEIGYKRAVEPLSQALKDKDRDVQESVIDALCYIYSNSAVNSALETLIQALKDKNKNVRRLSASALGWIQSERAAIPLIQALKDEDSRVRSSAAWALGQIRDKRARKPLIRVLKYDEDKDVKNAAEEALLWIIENGKYKRISNFDKLKENDRVELKSSLRWDIKKNCVNKELQKSIAKTIAAFLNTKGGTLYIGVKDDCTINGIEDDINSLKSKSIDDFGQALIQVIENYLGTGIIPLYIEIDYDEEEGKTICKVRVKKSKRPVYLKSEKGKYFYIRAGNTTRYLDIEEAVEYIKKHWRKVK